MRRSFFRVCGLFLAALALPVLTVGSATAASDLSGSVNISGSSTVEPITSLIAEKFAGKNPKVSVRVDGPGTGDGFKLFCNGDTDISDASRAITSTEIAQCQAKGIQYTELKIGIDGLSVISSADNKSLKCLSFKDLYALLGPESTGFTTWSAAQALATELGSTVTFPNKKLSVTAPGEESGTYDSFVELVLEPVAKTRTPLGKITKEQEKTSRKDYQSSANDNTIIKGITGSASSLGWVGFAFADENKDIVKSIAIDKGDGNCVKPSPKTVKSASYPISRFLYIYINKAKAASNPAVKAFVDYYMTKDGYKSVVEADYIQIPKTDWAATVAAWKAAAPAT